MNNLVKPTGGGPASNVLSRVLAQRMWCWTGTLVRGRG